MILSTDTQRKILQSLTKNAIYIVFAFMGGAIFFSFLGDVLRGEWSAENVRIYLFFVGMMIGNMQILGITFIIREHRQLLRIAKYSFISAILTYIIGLGEEGLDMELVFIGFMFGFFFTVINGFYYKKRILLHMDELKVIIWLLLLWFFIFELFVFNVVVGVIMAVPIVLFVFRSLSRKKFSKILQAFIHVAFIIIVLTVLTGVTIDYSWAVQVSDFDLVGLLKYFALPGILTAFFLILLPHILALFPLFTYTVDKSEKVKWIDGYKKQFNKQIDFLSGHFNDYQYPVSTIVSVFGFLVLILTYNLVHQVVSFGVIFMIVWVLASYISNVDSLKKNEHQT